MKLREIRECVEDLHDALTRVADRQAPDGMTILEIVPCKVCFHLEAWGANAHKEDCIVKKLIELVGAFPDTKWNTKRYCFSCKETTMFVLCENCSKYFCSDHCEYDEEYPDFSSVPYYSIPIHALCGI